MSEVELLYKNAGVEKREQGYCDWDSDCPYDMDRDCGKTCPYWVEEEPNYPPFAAEKKLELVKMILFSTWWMNLKRLQFSEKFDEGLAQMINELWQDLTEQERTEIRRILNGN